MKSTKIQELRVMTAGFAMTDKKDAHESISTRDLLENRVGVFLTRFIFPPMFISLGLLAMFSGSGHGGGFFGEEFSFIICGALFTILGIFLVVCQTVQTSTARGNHLTFKAMRIGFWVIQVGVAFALILALFQTFAEMSSK